MISNARFIPCAANSMIVSLLLLFVLGSWSPFAAARQGSGATLKGRNHGATNLNNLPVLVRIKELNQSAIPTVRVVDQLGQPLVLPFRVGGIYRYRGCLAGRDGAGRLHLYLEPCIWEHGRIPKLQISRNESA